MSRLAVLLGALAVMAIPAFVARLVEQALVRYELERMPWKRDAEPCFVLIPAGASASTAVASLVKAGVLRDAAAARRLLVRSGQAGALKAGEYRFDRPLSPAAVLGRLVAGEVFLRRITMPEGLTRFDMARRYAAEGLGEPAEFLQASLDPSPIADLDPEARDLEGYLFPETYRLGREEGAAELVRQMVGRFREVVGSDAGARADSLGMSLRQLVTLASLVEKETSRSDERALVAGVYRARLRRGMLLQADPTVIYGLILEGRWNGNLTRAHLREAGAYNTYATGGLPPGPIANPGRAALDAAFAPAETSYLYFVSKNDGSHAFSSTLGEHNRRVETYQKAPYRRRAAREGS